MTKYRIIEEGQKFYPQEKKTMLSPWRFLDNYWASSSWLDDKDECICRSMKDAINVIERRIKWKETAKKVIHKYPVIEHNEGDEQ
jgi:hypothetical protein